MKLQYCFLSVLLFTFPYSEVYAQPTDIIIKRLTGFFVNNDAELENGMNYVVITKEKQFNKLLGVAKTMRNVIYNPDFKKEIVLLLALPETRKETVIEYVKAIKAGNFIEVFYKVKRSYPITYTIRPQALAVVPRYPGITTYKFYEGNKLMRVEKIK